MPDSCRSRPNDRAPGARIKGDVLGGVGADDAAWDDAVPAGYVRIWRMSDAPELGPRRANDHQSPDLHPRLVSA
jgi:hypothetical protein